YVFSSLNQRMNTFQRYMILKEKIKNAPNIEKNFFTKRIDDIIGDSITDEMIINMIKKNQTLSYLLSLKKLNENLKERIILEYLQITQSLNKLKFCADKIAFEGCLLGEMLKNNSIS